MTTSKVLSGHNIHEADDGRYNYVVVRNKAVYECRQDKGSAGKIEEYTQYNYQGSTGSAPSLKAT